MTSNYNSNGPELYGLIDDNRRLYYMHPPCVQTSVGSLHTDVLVPTSMPLVFNTGGWVHGKEMDQICMD